ncbi:putative quinol monooxygenase [Algoriphagus sp. A40]|uniref:putative quinol monooxygenase n=1 Tax=Algoriphagus sp. A40 TaxID=1945863 RepID=UPI000987C228|nr:antibiotic biosynthesis monooxygenase family protein [Algoriphagus sp. A40]OOG74922.1 antibiotic biosynthesis monooxygenase [Algoriphagus sp. A40]
MKAIIVILIMMLTQITFQTAFAQEKGQLVRLAILVIDSAYLEEYKVFLKEGVETALRVEPGVITIYALSEKENPSHFTILETYASDEAYQTHIKTPHFLKYKNGTLHMVKSLELVETVPLLPELKVSQIRSSTKKDKP